MIIFYNLNLVGGGSPADESAMPLVLESKTWIGIGIASVLLFMVRIPWP